MEKKIVSIRLNAFAYVWLCSLALATTGLAYLPLGILNIPVAMLIAVIKTVIIVLIFMQVRWADRLIWAVLAVILAFMFIMAGLTLADYLTRIRP